MALFKKLFFTPLHLSRTKTLLPPPSRTHVLLISLFLLFLLLLSSSLADHSQAFQVSAFASRLRFAVNLISPFSYISPSNTCLLTSSQSNCTLPSVPEVKGTGNGRRRKDHDDNRGGDDEGLSSCDIFNGKWVLDHDSVSGSVPVYKPGSCPFIDGGFDCYKNGRADLGYLGYIWRPDGCRIPRFDGRKMLGILRGKRLVFVGDSLNRNMWQSLVCLLRESLKNKNRIFEVSGRQEFRTKGFYSIRFRDYKCSIDFIRSRFLVQELKFSDRITGIERETLRLDMIQEGSKYKHADIIIFNTGHWWTHQTTQKMKDYFQEGSHVYNKLQVTVAYTKAIRTWAQWIDGNINSSRTRVFFMGYSASHFRKDKWNYGGRCDGETEPIKDESKLAPYPWMMKVLESVMAEMKTPVFYFNITKMTGFRVDGHPAIYRQPTAADIPTDAGLIQDCSHWCLPGVPDFWNQLLYATLRISRDVFVQTH